MFERTMTALGCARRYKPIEPNTLQDPLNVREEEKT
jgi:hypothetical protein